MRTTVEIDDDLLEVAREISRVRHSTLGRTLSDLAKRGLQLTSVLRLGEENGVPVILHEPGAVTITSEMVWAIQDSEDDPLAVGRTRITNYN